MLHAAQKAMGYAQDLTEQAFMKSSLHQDGVVRQLMILGEACKHLSPEIRQAHPEIPWKKIAGFRDVLIHDYFEVDLKKVWQILKEDLPMLITSLKAIAPPEEP
jgi:uncharacterized protein with HEPN domain